MGTKKGRIYGKGAPFKGVPQKFGGQLPQTVPPGSPTVYQGCATFYYWRSKRN